MMKVACSAGDAATASESTCFVGTFVIHMPNNSSAIDSHSHGHQLPSEIIDEIVDYLQDDKKALKAISLSSHLFLHRARKYLFSTLVLKVRKKTKRDKTVTPLPSRKIFCVIKFAAHLIPYIQVLEIAGEATRLNLDHQFSKALGLFQQMVEIEVENSALQHIYLSNIVWTDLSMDIRDAIGRILSFRSLKKVSTDCTRGVPWTVFENISTNVTTLNFDNAFFYPEVECNETDDEWPDDDSSLPGNSTTPAPLINKSAIERLRIEALYVAYGTLGDDPTIIVAHDSVLPLNTAHLRTFWALLASNGYWSRYQEFISHIGHSLETLGFIFEPLYDQVLPPLDCRQLDNLKHLHVQTSYKFQRLTLQSAFVWLHETLQTLPSQHQLQTIVIRCIVGTIEGLRHVSHWEHIDMFLTQPRFDSLRQIRVVLQLRSEKDKAAYITFLQAAPFLPRLMAKGIVMLDTKPLPPDYSPFGRYS